MTNEQLKNLETTKDYFRKVDSNDPSLLTLFADDVQIFFPKFGIGKGQDDLIQFVTVFGSTFSWISHHFEQFNFIVAGKTVVVEGSESGELKNGRKWENSRFCSVFEFSDGKICRMHLYEDPDLTGSHEEGFLWGHRPPSIWIPS